jgi:hypothetical protein
MTSSLTAALSEIKELARATLDFDPDNCNGAEQNARAAFVRACRPALVMALADAALESYRSRPPFQNCHCKCCAALRRLNAVCATLGEKR